MTVSQGKRAFALALLLTSLVLGCALAGCDEKLDAWPDTSAGPGDVVDVGEVLGPLCSAARPVPVDVLWVIDNSTSMAQEHAAMAATFGRFTQALSTVGVVDLHTAVVTTQFLGEDGGRFWTTPAQMSPPSAQERRYFPARSDLHCECAACAGWDDALAVQRCLDRDECVGVEIEGTYMDCLQDGGCVDDPVAARWSTPLFGGSSSNMYNANGSVNVSCSFQCGDAEDPDALCRSQFGQRWECQVPGGDYGSSGCVVIPDTADCPEGMPGVLPGVAADGTPVTVQDHFRCISAVGARQDVDANLEGGMLAAWMALASDGPFPDQICAPDIAVGGATEPASRRATCPRQLLRPGALLVVVFVSDEDDCSVAEGKRIVAEDYNQCALLGDSELPLYALEYLPEQGENTDYLPLAPPRVYAERLRSLLPDGSSLFVGTITGDAIERETMTDEELLAERLDFYGATTDEANPYRLDSYMCTGINGSAALGYRYIQLAEQFGDGGFVGNVCDPDGMGAVLEDLGRAVAAQLPCDGDDGEGAE